MFQNALKHFDFIIKALTLPKRRRRRAETAPR
jgi:hypothetical protein